MLYEIASHPDFQDELREEICAVPDHSFDNLNNGLPLLDAAFKETLRLHPAILENHHEVCNAAQHSDGVTYLSIRDSRPPKRSSSHFQRGLLKVAKIT